MSELAKKAYEMFKKPDAPSWEELERKSISRPQTADRRPQPDLAAVGRPSSVVSLRQEAQVKTRPFLPRPLGREETSDPWEVWAPLFEWLIERYPDRFYTICEAEEAIRALEQVGITEGQEYEAACAELLKRFEEARRLKMREAVKVWWQ